MVKVDEGLKQVAEKFFLSLQHNIQSKSCELLISEYFHLSFSKWNRITEAIEGGVMVQKEYCDGKGRLD